MTRPLFDSVVAGRRLRVVATDRTDGDIHPLNVAAHELGIRQRSVTSPDRRWSMVDQVHGVDVIDIDVDRRADGDGDRGWAPTSGVADVIVTKKTLSPIAIWAADCAPIVLAADDGTLVGAHGGWVGLAAGVVDVAVAAATRGGGAVVAAVLGPVIHPCCYEFDLEDLARVPDAVEGRTAGGRRALDVPATVAASLARNGIELDASGPCTGCDDRWFSHRVRSEPGRHAVVAEWSVAA